MMDPLINRIKNLLKPPKTEPVPPSEVVAPVGVASHTIDRRVLLIEYNPAIPSQGGKRLSQVLGWGDIPDLTGRLIHDLRDASYGYANFILDRRTWADYFPLKEDGFAYTPQHYLDCWNSHSGFHQPDAVNYQRILTDFDIIGRVNRDEIDEVWLFGFPYAGFYESRMAGPDAYWCNAPPLEGTEPCLRRFVIMGFNYERGVGEMLESMAHRAESIMERVFAGRSGEDNLWQRFTRYDLRDRGRAEVGTVHFASNSQQDYDWGNPRQVPSRCDAWYHFPDLSGSPRMVNTSEWGGGDTRLHHLWWFRHFPHSDGQSGGMLYNWWEYVLNP